MYLLRFSVVGRKLRGKKLSPLCPEIILNWFNPFLHDWHYSISRGLDHGVGHPPGLCAMSS